MKVAFLLSDFPTISETFILNQITGLIDRGCEIDILANLPGDQSVTQPDVERYGLLAKTSYRNAPRRLAPRVRAGIKLFMTKVWRHPGPVVRSINVFRYGRQAASFTLLGAAIALLPKQRYDVIHCHFGPFGLLATALRDIGVLEGKVITTFYGYDLTSYLRRCGPHIYDRLFDDGDLLLPLSNAFQHRLIELGCRPEKTRVHHIGIDCSRFKYVPRRPSTDGCTRIVTIARLAEKKGLEYGIRAVVDLVRRNRNIDYVIVGDGPMRDELTSLIERLDAGAFVRLRGWCNQAEIIRVLEQSHILLTPSVTAADGDQEGTPTVLMEGAAMGLPVVSTLHSGIPEIVEDGASGYLVPERDVDALAQRLDHLVTHPELWPEMGAAGRQIIEAHFNIDKLNDQLVDIYQQVVSGISP